MNRSAVMPRLRLSYLLSSLLAPVLLLACSSEGPQQVAGIDEGAEAKSSKQDADGTGDTERKGRGETAARTSGGDGDDDEIEDEAAATKSEKQPSDVLEVADVRGPTAEELLKQCGMPADGGADPAAVLLDKKMRGWPVLVEGSQPLPLFGSIKYKVTIIPVVSVKATINETVQTTDFEVSANPTSALSEAKKKTDAERGTTTATAPSSEERAALLTDSPLWKDIVCGIQPMKMLSTTKGGKTKVVRFDPPLPASIWPKADAIRYKADIGAGRTFDIITAEVMSSTDAGLPVGRKYVGKAKVSLVEPKVTLKDANGVAKEFTADLAVRIDWDFGSPAITASLGLMLSQTFYINYATRDFRMIGAETGVKDVPTTTLAESF